MGERARLADFGMAHHIAPQVGEGSMQRSLAMSVEAGPGSIVGTPAFMAPEVLTGGLVLDDIAGWKRADVYSMGLTLALSMLGAGAVKHGRGDPEDLMRLPLSVYQLLDQCLKANPERRPVDARQLMRGLVRTEDLAAEWTQPASQSANYGGWEGAHPHAVHVSAFSPADDSVARNTPMMHHYHTEPSDWTRNNHSIIFPAEVVDGQPLLRRGEAYVIDTIICAAATLAFMLVANEAEIPSFYVTQGPGGIHTIHRTLMGYFTPFTVFFALLALRDVAQSGKRLAGLRVVNADTHKPASIFSCIQRNFVLEAGTILFVELLMHFHASVTEIIIQTIMLRIAIFGWMLYTESEVRLGDRWANTLVLRRT